MTLFLLSVFFALAVMILALDCARRPERLYEMAEEIKSVPFRFEYAARVAFEARHEPIPEILKH